MIVTGQIIGFIGIIANMAIYWQNDRKALLKIKFTSDVLWALHYFLLGGYSGCAVACIGMLRETIFINSDKKWASGKKWLVVFLILSIISAIATYKNILSVLPAVASILSVVSFWQASPTKTRWLSLPISFCMLAYDIVSGSVSGIVNELMTEISSVSAIIKNRKA